MVDRQAPHRPRCPCIVELRQRRERPFAARDSVAEFFISLLEGDGRFTASFRQMSELTADS